MIDELFTIPLQNNGLLSKKPTKKVPPLGGTSERRNDTHG